MGRRIAVSYKVHTQSAFFSRLCIAPTFCVGSLDREAEKNFEILFYVLLFFSVIVMTACVFWACSCRRREYVGEKQPLLPAYSYYSTLWYSFTVLPTVQSTTTFQSLSVIILLLYCHISNTTAFTQGEESHRFLIWMHCIVACIAETVLVVFFFVIGGVLLFSPDLIVPSFTTADTAVAVWAQLNSRYIASSPGPLLWKGAWGWGYILNCNIHNDIHW